MQEQSIIYQLFSVNGVGDRSLVSRDTSLDRIMAAMHEYNKNKKLIQLFNTNKLEIEEVTTRLVTRSRVF